MMEFKANQINLFILTLLEYLLLLWASSSAGLTQSPCRFPLGMRHQHHDPTLTFDLWATSSDANGARLNSPAPWVPDGLADDFLLIKTSRPVLITGVQTQGRPHSPDRVIRWTLETSMDCENYQAHNYTSGILSSVETSVTGLNHPEFASCIRVWPRAHAGASPALRLELLGCVVSEASEACSQDTDNDDYPVESGRQINFEQETVVAWIRVRLSQSKYQNDTETTLSIFYSRSCNTDDWRYLEPSTLTTAWDSSADHWIWAVHELEFPVRAKCLQVVAEPPASVEEIVTNKCSASDLPRIHKINGINQDDMTSQDKRDHLSLTKEDNETLSLLKQVLGIFDEETTDGVPENEHDNKSYDLAESFTAPQSDNFTRTSPGDDHFGDLPFSFNVSHSGTNNTSRARRMEVLSPNYNSSNHEPNDYAVSETSSPSRSSSKSGSSTISILSSKVVRESTTIPIPHSDGKDSSDLGYAEKTDGIVHSNLKDDRLYASKSVPYRQEGRHESTDTGRGSRTNTECGIRPDHPTSRRKRVVAGELNTPGQWPWLVSLHFLPPMNFTTISGFKHLCGGTLIAPQWVATAAHCFEDLLFGGLENVTNWEVKVGIYDQAMENDIPGSRQNRTIQSFYKYPKYDASVLPFEFDIALLRLDEPVELLDSVSTICLHDIQHKDTEIYCSVSGWGQLSEDTPGSRYPYTTSIKTLTSKHCNSSFEALEDGHPAKAFFVRVTDRILCAQVGSAGQDACNGDSGGPLMCEYQGRWHLTGIVSAGFECGNPVIPAIYTRVSRYIEWIKETMKKVDSDFDGGVNSDTDDGHKKTSGSGRIEPPL